jgi:hypothetical protein
MHSPMRDHTVGEALNNSGPSPREIARRQRRKGPAVNIAGLPELLHRESDGR